jgi:endonuclease YncB( thermonuclease family)
VSINNPRRIFRSSLPAKGVALVALAVSLAAIGTVLTARSRQTSGGYVAAEPDTGSVRLTAAPGEVAVVDGGTLRLGERVVRLVGVEPPPRDTSCQAATGTAIDCGAAATQSLAALVWALPVTCQTRGRDALGRAFATCEAGGTDLSRAQAAAGWGDGRVVPAQQERATSLQNRGAP